MTFERISNWCFTIIVFFFFGLLIGLENTSNLRYILDNCSLEGNVTVTAIENVVPSQLP